MLHKDVEMQLETKESELKSKTEKKTDSKLPKALSKDTTTGIDLVSHVVIVGLVPRRSTRKRTVELDSEMQTDRKMKRR